MIAFDQIRKYNSYFIKFGIQIQIQVKVNSMGSGISVDKRTTSLDDWLQIHQQLQSTTFEAEIENHIVLWKLLPQQNHSAQIISVPVAIDIYSSHNIFSHKEAYIVLAIKNLSSASIIDKQIPSNLASLLYSIQQNIQQDTYKAQIAKGTSSNGCATYAIYSFFGKSVSNKMQMAALAYALKLHASLSVPNSSQMNPQNTQKKLTILSAGGFIKNKKLQAGSTTALCKQHSNASTDSFKFQKIGIYKFFLENLNKKLTIFNYGPKRNIVKIQRSRVSSQNFNSNFVDQKQAQSSYNGTGLNKLNLNLKAISKVQTSFTAQVNNGFNNATSQNLNNNVSAMQTQKIHGIKPPMLKLTLKPYEDVTYEQISDQHQNGIKFDIRATARHQLKMQKFGEQCNQVVDGLFVSGEKIAKDYEALRKHNITEIINCAGDYCQNWHADKGINYLTFFLKDSQNQNIECLFYRAIQFIQNAHKNKKNVLVHCIQGISRSITFCIAYIIFTHGLDYKKAEFFVKSKRGIACPNNGFMVQLIQFHKRLYEHVSLLPLPRVFLVSSHSKETPSIITARMIKQPLFDPRKYLGLDARAIYIIQTADVIYLWVGSKCEQNRLKKYWTFAQDYIKKLQRYERAPQNIKAISQGSEQAQFFRIWELNQAPPLFQNQQYNRLFHQGQQAKVGGLRKYYEREQEKAVSKRLFIYPDTENGLGVFEQDDLCGLCILINSQDDKLKVYLYKEQDFKICQQDQSQFLDTIIKDHYANFDQESIIIMEQSETGLSQDFINQFS